MRATVSRFVACALLVMASRADDSFDLNSVKAMTFRFDCMFCFGDVMPRWLIFCGRRGEMTKGRRTSPIPKVNCQADFLLSHEINKTMWLLIVLFAVNVYAR